VDPLEELREAVHAIDVRLARVETAAVFRDRLLWWILGLVTGNLLAVVITGTLLLLRR